MSHTYFSTFISGFSPVIEKALKEKVPDIALILEVDGLIVYQSHIGVPQMIAELPFFNNSFFLLELEKSDLQSCIKHIMHKVDDLVVHPTILEEKKSFRVIFSKKNQHIALPSYKLLKIENAFAKKLRLKVDRANPDLEIWFLERSQGYSLCGIRLTKKPSTEKYLQQGELRPELAWLICFLSEPSASDVFLDPFAGYNSIPNIRTMFPFKRIIASDMNKQKAINNEQNIEFHIWDAAHLPLPDASIDKIVTDPPWGIFEKQYIERLYVKALSEFGRVLKKGGIFVVLTAQKELLENLMSGMKDFALMEQYTILVSGKKASVYKYGKS